MPIIADTHVHIYSCYELKDFFRHAFANLNALMPRSANGRASSGQPGEAWEKALFLTESSGNRFFKELGEKAGSELNGYTVRESPEPQALVITSEQEDDALYLVAGRQIVTRERLEVLALTVDADLPDGQGLEEIVEAVRAEGGVPALAWAPGKWLFRRGRLIRNLIRQHGPEYMLIGDSSLRPGLWATPRLMKRALDKGYTLIAGSDPLPFAGEERQAGRYGTMIEGALDSERPVTELRRLLRSDPASVKPAGRRGSLPEVIERMRNYYRVKGRPPAS